MSDLPARVLRRELHQRTRRHRGGRAAASSSATTWPSAARRPRWGVIEATVEYAHARGARVMAMVRPRGGDFVYDEVEVQMMETDARIALALGADGIVLGCLKRGRRGRARARRGRARAHLRHRPRGPPRSAARPWTSRSTWPSTRCPDERQLDAIDAIDRARLHAHPHARRRRRHAHRRQSRPPRRLHRARRRTPHHPAGCRHYVGERGRGGRAPGRGGVPRHQDRQGCVGGARDRHQYAASRPAPLGKTRTQSRSLRSRAIRRWGALRGGPPIRA